MRRATASRPGVLPWLSRPSPTDFGGDMSPGWVARLDEELPNLRAAITWLLARGEATRALRLLVAAEDFWTPTAHQ